MRCFELMGGENTYKLSQFFQQFLLNSTKRCGFHCTTYARTLQFHVNVLPDDINDVQVSMVSLERGPYRLYDLFDTAHALKVGHLRFAVPAIIGHA